METLKGSTSLIGWKTWLLLNTGNVDFKVSMDESERAMWVLCIMSPKGGILQCFRVFFSSR